MKRLLLLALFLASIGCVSQTQSLKVPSNQSVPSLTVGAGDVSDQLILLTEENAKLRQQIDEMNLSLEHYQGELLAYQERLRTRGISNASGLYGYAMLDGPAVRQWIKQEGTFPFIVQTVVTEGQMLTISAEVDTGKGRVLVVTNPRMGTIFQDTANTALIVAEDVTNKSLGGSDVIFSVNGSKISSVDGPSAGALMTIVLVSALDNRSLNQSVTITGTISQDGSIGPIGGVVDKAEAAKEAGKALFLLSKANSRLVKWEEKLYQQGIITYVTRVPVYLDAEEYIEENVGINVEYVEDIEDALEHFTQG